MPVLFIVMLGDCISWLNLIGSPDGIITAVVHNSAMTDSLLKQIWQWWKEGCSDTDVITRLRQKTVPPGYEIHTWVQDLLFSFDD